MLWPGCRGCCWGLASQACSRKCHRSSCTKLSAITRRQFLVLEAGADPPLKRCLPRQVQQARLLGDDECPVPALPPEFPALQGFTRPAITCRPLRGCQDGALLIPAERGFVPPLHAKHNPLSSGSWLAPGWTAVLGVDCLLGVAGGGPTLPCPPHVAQSFLLRGCASTTWKAGSDFARVLCTAFLVGLRAGVLRFSLRCQDADPNMVSVSGHWPCCARAAGSNRQRLSTLRQVRGVLGRWGWVAWQAAPS